MVLKYCEIEHQKNPGFFSRECFREKTKSLCVLLSFSVLLCFQNPFFASFL